VWKPRVFGIDVEHFSFRGPIPAENGIRAAAAGG
jgi:hypothetical protein